MINKALFKQSVRSNRAIWSVVTLITCSILAIVFVMINSMNINDIKISVMNMFVTSSIETNIKKQSMNMYELATQSINTYTHQYENLDELLNNQLDQDAKLQLISTYDSLTQQGLTKEQALTEMTTPLQEDYALVVTTFIDYYLVNGDDYSSQALSEYIKHLVASNVAKMQVLPIENDTNITDLVVSILDGFVVAVTSVHIYASDFVATTMQHAFYPQSIDYNGDIVSVSDYFSKEQIFNISKDVVFIYNVSMAAQIELIDELIKEESNYPELSEEEISVLKNNLLLQKQNEVVNDLSAGVIESMDGGAINAMAELTEMDIYELVVGSIFFKIAGVLLPLIYTIVVANNLIAHQVDTGSLAFVLSTPTKRRTVTFTQMMFLVSSLFLMFLCTTIVSMTTLFLLNNATIGVSFYQLFLLNIGIFLTLFAISGICFLASCWFNNSKTAMTVGGGVSIFFLVATILSLVGSTALPRALRIEAMSSFNYLSIISLFDTSSILNNTQTYLWKYGVLIVIGIVAYVIGILKFNKKDLPL